MLRVITRRTSEYCRGFFNVHYTNTWGAQNKSADISGQMNGLGTIYKISYDLSQDYRKFIVRSTYDNDLQRAKSSLGNIVI